MTYVTNKQRILSALRRSKRGLNHRQITDKLGIEANSFYACVSKLRQEHYPVMQTLGSDGLTRYSISE